MVQAGLGGAVIVNKIRASGQTAFKLTTDDLLQLRQDKVGYEVIEAMLEAQSETRERDPASTPAAREAESDPNNPNVWHDAGIYYYDAENGQPKLTPLAFALLSEAKTSGLFTSVLTQGISKVKFKTSIPQPQAALQLNTPRPIFYFYFETDDARQTNPDDTARYALSPKDFMLVQLSPKKDAREMLIGQANIFGAESDTLDKNAHPFDVEKVGSGIYKVTPRYNLKEGEYGFYEANPQPGEVGTIFDFGIKLNPVLPAPTTKP